jgi:hypothetical protein
MSTHPPNSELWIPYRNINLLGLYNSKMLPIVFFDACLTSKINNNKTTIDLNIAKEYFIQNLMDYIFKFISQFNGKILERFKSNFLSKIATTTDNNPESREDSELSSCFAWNWLNKGNGGGAIATIGATETAFGGTDSGAGKMSIEFFSAYEKNKALGQMMSDAQFGYIIDVPWDLFTLEEFILLGDPSLKIGGYETKNKSNFLQ